MKRVFDVVVSLSALIVLAPLMVVVAVLTWISIGRPVFYVQKRPGRMGRPFDLVKFRTMRSAVGAGGEPLPDSLRITRLGRVLRSLSIDELPELVNVLRGEMSLVGPRPLLLEYLPLYSPEQARRHDVLPGITGWAQVNGRNAISWERKFELDVWYVDNQSFLLDLRILVMTVSRVLRREGISAPGQATVTRFTGST